MTKKTRPLKTNLELLIEDHHRRLASLESGSHPAATSFGKRLLARKWELLTLLVAIVGCAIAYFAWWQPQLQARAESEFAHNVNDRIETKLDDHHFDQMASDVSELKGQMKEISGYLKLLTEKELHIQAALSQPEFDRQIPAVGTALSVARLVHADASSEVLNGIGSRLVRSEHSQPDFWKTAGQLISYRSEVKSNFTRRELPNCFNSEILGYHINNASHGIADEVTISLSDCRIQIDDLAGFSRSELRDRMANAVVGVSVLRYKLDLTRAEILYRGGAMINVQSFSLHDCTFDFEAPENPLPPAKVFTTELLAAGSNEIQVKLPTS